MVGLSKAGIHTQRSIGQRGLKPAHRRANYQQPLPDRRIAQELIEKRGEPRSAVSHDITTLPRDMAQTAGRDAPSFGQRTRVITL